MNCTTPKILTQLAHSLQTEVKNGRVDIPEKFGKGYCAGCFFDGNIRILILNYELNEDLHIDNPEKDIPGEMILFKFQSIFRPEAKKGFPSVLIATSRVNKDEIISIQNASSLNIEVDSLYLNELFELSDKSTVLQSLSENNRPLLYEELVVTEIQAIVDEIVSGNVNEDLRWIFRKIKTEEVICRLLMELKKRDERQLHSLNGNDIKTLYAVKEEILQHLGTPPIIQNLAKQANMSPSKLKTLFKQIFGDSIYKYYQGFRMKEAVRLLQEERLSVSEVGYQLGFSNLSHFSRVFEEHIGIKPKKFSKTISG